MRAIAEEALVGRGEDAAIPCFDLIRDDNRVAEEVRPSLRKTRRTSRGEPAWIADGVGPSRPRFPRSRLRRSNSLT
jgi:hypothetical protein